MRPPLPPTINGTFARQSRRITSLERGQFPTNQPALNAQLSIIPADGTRFTGAAPDDTRSMYFSEWYRPTVPVTYTELAVQGPGQDALGNYVRLIPTEDGYTSGGTFPLDLPRMNIAIQIADPGSQLINFRWPAFVEGGRPLYVPIDSDEQLRTAGEFQIRYPRGTDTGLYVFKLPTPVRVDPLRMIRVVRWLEPVAPVDPEPGVLTEIDWVNHRVMDVPFTLFGRARQTVTADVTSLAIDPVAYGDA